MENAAIIFNNTQPIFLIDPSGSATQFITNFYAQNVQLLNANQSDLLTQVYKNIKIIKNFYFNIFKFLRLK